MNRTKLLKIAAGTLAGVALGGAIVYFNFVDNAPEPTLEVFAEAPDFTMQTYYVEDDQFKTGGEEFVLSEQKKVTVINFWATWCGGCIEEMPYFSRLQEHYSEYVDVFVITDQESNAKNYEALCAWMNGPVPDEKMPAIYEKYEKWTDYAFTFGFYDVSQNNVYANYGFTGGLPATVIVDENGIVRYLKAGSMNYEMLETEIRRVLPSDAEPLPIEGFEEITLPEKNWWKENVLGVTFLAVSTVTLGAAIVVSAVGSSKGKKKKKVK